MQTISEKFLEIFIPHFALHNQKKWLQKLFFLYIIHKNAEFSDKSV